MPADAALARTLLDSPNGSERAVGAYLAAGDPSLVSERVPALLADDVAEVRAFALRALAVHPDARAAGRLALAWWRGREAAGPVAAHEFLLSDGTALRMALTRLQSRITPGSPLPPAAPPSDLEEWEQVFR
jgi:hypothetical protein